MQSTDSYEKLDETLSRADELMQTDYAAAIRLLGSFAMEFEAPGSADPFTDSYRDWVLGTYRRIANQDLYDPEKAELDPNVSRELPFPDYFPFSTKDPSFIGSYMMGVGNILRNLALPSGSRVIEYGVGWGHVSAALARAGYAVTCVDIEPKFLEIARRQAKALGNHLDIWEGHFGCNPDEGSKFDGVIFFEAFHHALEHGAVVESIRDLLRPGGRLVLCGEPIDPSFPVPWGLRRDGHALWAVRRFGWMELGFQESYFIRLLLRSGFLVQKEVTPNLGLLGLLYHCTRHDGRVELDKTMLPADEEETWILDPATKRRFAQWASRLTLDQSNEWQSATVHAANYLPVSLEMNLYCGSYKARHNFQPGEHRNFTIPLHGSNRVLHIGSEMRVPREVGGGPDARALGVTVEAISYNGA
ncbi:class I SAM-dependent methyltransferase [Inquilinus sp.]|uniref:class I SAM-dependent methyltransferase n=1 Tax=Inquilinus sp. TaxID=1932117 RepID=UPI0031E1E9E3